MQTGTFDCMNNSASCIDQMPCGGFTHLCFRSPICARARVSARCVRTILVYVLYRWCVAEGVLFRVWFSHVEE